MSDSASTTPADSLGGGLRRAVAGLLLGVGSSAHFTWPVRLEPDVAREGRGTGDASSPDRPSIAVRELRPSDEQAWRALRLADNDRLAPWEATLPAGGGETPSAFAGFVRPVLRQIAGRTSLHRSSLPATISEGWHSPSGKREFVPVHVSGSPSRGYRAEPTTPPGTVRLHGLSEANAIAVVPEDTSTVVAGDTLHCLLLDA